MKICLETPYLVKNQTKISAPLYEDLSRFYCCRQHIFVIKSFLCNTVCFIVDSDMYLDNTRRAHYFVSIATVIMRRRRNIIL